jgi:predicted nucleotidyltransferase
MDLKFFLEDLLGSKVDLVTRAALKPALRPEIERDAIRVA